MSQQMEIPQRLLHKWSYLFIYIYHFQKRRIVKAIQYKNCAELFVLNGNKRPIRYEFHNSVKPNRHNGNMV